LELQQPSGSWFRYFSQQADMATFYATNRDMTIAVIPGGATDFEYAGV
jgi:hypothetical protein